MKVLSPEDLHCPLCSKLAYPTEQGALSELAKLWDRERRGHWHRPLPVRVYQCERGWWHFASSWSRKD